MCGVSAKQGDISTCVLSLGRGGDAGVQGWSCSLEAQQLWASLQRAFHPCWVPGSERGAFVKPPATLRHTHQHLQWVFLFSILLTTDNTPKLAVHLTTAVARGALEPATTFPRETPSSHTLTTPAPHLAVSFQCTQAEQQSGPPPTPGKNAGITHAPMPHRVLRSPRCTATPPPRP